MLDLPSCLASILMLIFTLLFLTKVTSAVLVRDGVKQKTAVQDSNESQTPQESSSARTSGMAQLASSSLPRTTSKFSSSNPADIELRRREKVARFRHRYEELKSTILTKDPVTLTKGEKNEISLLRMELTAQMGDYRRRIGAYLPSLITDLEGIRGDLPYNMDHRDKATKEVERRQQWAEWQSHYRTRKKARKFGVNVTVKRGRKPLNDNAPLKLVKNREKATRYIRRPKRSNMDVGGLDRFRSDMITEQGEITDLLPNSWGMKRPRKS